MLWDRHSNHSRLSSVSSGSTTCPSGVSPPTVTWCLYTKRWSWTSYKGSCPRPPVAWRRRPCLNPPQTKRHRSIFEGPSGATESVLRPVDSGVELGRTSSPSSMAATLSTHEPGTELDTCSHLWPLFQTPESAPLPTAPPTGPNQSKAFGVVLINMVDADFSI